MIPETKPKNVISINLDHGCLLCGENGAAQNGFCLECLAIAPHLTVPKPNEFRDEETNREVEYLLAAELARIGERLVRHYEDDFSGIEEAEIDYFWKKKGGSAGGKLTLGKCVKVTGPLKYYSKRDYLIWLAADNCFSLSKDLFRLTALVFHELCHCWLNGANGNYDQRGHDLEVFNREIEIFGPWKSDIKATGEAFEKARQGKLFK